MFTYIFKLDQNWLSLCVVYLSVKKFEIVSDLIRFVTCTTFKIKQTTTDCFFFFIKLLNINNNEYVD